MATTESYNLNPHSSIMRSLPTDKLSKWFGVQLVNVERKPRFDYDSYSPVNYDDYYNAYVVTCELGYSCWEVLHKTLCDFFVFWQSKKDASVADIDAKLRVMYHEMVSSIICFPPWHVPFRDKIADAVLHPATTAPSGGSSIAGATAVRLSDKKRMIACSSTVSVARDYSDVGRIFSPEYTVEPVVILGCNTSTFVAMADAISIMSNFEYFRLINRDFNDLCDTLLMLHLITKD